MKKILALGLGLSSLTAYSDEYIGVEQMNIEYYEFKANRDPYVPLLDNKLKYRIGVNFTVHVLNFAYWKNFIATEARETRVETVGWKYEAGFRIAKYIDVFWFHWSRHQMENKGATYDYAQGKKGNYFPVEDSIGLRINLITDTGKRNYLFGE